MSSLIDLIDAFLQPLRNLSSDAAERIYWPYILGALALPLVGLGVRRGGTELRQGLFRRQVWLHASSRADVVLLLVKSGLALVVSIPWATATLAATLSVGLWLHDVLGPAPDLEWWPRPMVGVLYSLVLFVAWDFSRFAVHRLLHVVPWLWEFHQVHHSAEVLTPLTLYRTHPVETLLFDLRGFLTTSIVAGVFLYVFRGRAVELQILGIHALGFVFNLWGANLRHSHVWLRFGAWERFFISPAQHQMHHGRQRSQQSANYGTWLAMWDRWAGTWQPAPIDPIREVGLGHCNHRRDGVISMLVDPVREVIRRIRAKTSPLTRFVAIVAMTTFSRPSQAAPGAAPQPTAPPPAAPGSHDKGEANQDRDDSSVISPAPGPSDDGEVSQDRDDSSVVSPAPGSVGVGDEPVDSPSTEPNDSPAADPTDDRTAHRDDTASDPPGSTDERDVAATEPATDRTSATDDDASASIGEARATDDDASASGGEAPASDETFELELPDAPPEELTIDTVAVEGTAEPQSNVPGSVQIIEEEELERREYDDIHRVLRTVPGVYVREEDGFGLRPNIGMRGVNSDRSAKVTLMEDGVLLGPAPYSAPAAYYFPLMTRIASVGVYKGPGSIVFGPSTVGGAIDLRTRSIPSTMTGFVDVGAGMRGYLKGHGYWGTSTKHFGVLIEGAHIQSNGFKELDNGGDTGFDKTELMVKGRYNVDPGRRVYHQVDVKIGFGREHSDETYLGLTQADFDQTPYRRYAGSARDAMDWWRTQGELRYYLARGPLIDFEVVAYRHDISRAWRKFNRFAGQNLTLSPHDIVAYPSGRNATLVQVLSGRADSLNLANSFDETLLIGTNDRRYVSQGVSAVMHVRPRWRRLEQDIQFGARLHHDSIRRLHDEVGYVMRSGVLVPDAAYATAFGNKVITAHNRHAALAGAFHLVDTIKISRVTMTPGARVEVIGTSAENRLTDTTQENRQAAFVPGMGIHVQTTSWLGLFAGVHSGFSPVAPGQPDSIDPERSINYELGGRVLHRGTQTETRAEAIGFFNDYYNLTFNCSQSRGCLDDMLDRQFEGGRAFIYGAELSASETFRNRKGTFWFDARGSYTYTGSQFRTSFASADPLLSDVQRGDAVPYLPQHIAALALGIGGRIWTTEFSGAYVGEMRDVAGQGDILGDERIPRYFILDFNTHVSVTRRATLYLTINNLLNTPYMVSQRPYGARPGMPLQLMGGFKYEIQRS